MLAIKTCVTHTCATTALTGQGPIVSEPKTFGAPGASQSPSPAGTQSAWSGHSLTLAPSPVVSLPKTFGIGASGNTPITQRTIQPQPTEEQKIDALLSNLKASISCQQKNVSQWGEELASACQAQDLKLKNVLSRALKFFPGLSFHSNKASTLRSHEFVDVLLMHFMDLERAANTTAG